MTLSAPQPFLKWVGGKRQLLPAILPLLGSFGGYFEPFLGGGAVALSLLARETPPARVSLSDANEELIHAYRIVRDTPTALLTLLHDHAERHSEAHYYDVRAWGSESLAREERAARTIYLNKAGFNGLFRVRKKDGGFNVPWGKHKRFDPNDENIVACSRALQKASFFSGDFSETVNGGTGAQPGDLVYFDPPYNLTFTGFTKDGFADADQVRLAELVRCLVDKGIHCVVSNADDPRIRELYQKFYFVEVSRKGTMSSKGSARGRVGELLITSRPVKQRHFEEALAARAEDE